MSHVLVVELYVGGVTEITHVVIISSMLSTHVKYEHVFMMSDVLLMRKNDTQTLVMQMFMPFGSLRLKRYMFFTRGQFWPPGIVVACVCVCLSVCLSVCQSLACPRDNSGPVQAGIKFGPKMQKTLVKVPIVLGAIDLDLQGQIKRKNQNLPHLELVRTITHYPFKLASQNLDQRWKVAWWRSLFLLCWVAIDLDLQGQIWFKLWNFSTKLICAVFVNI